MHFYVIHNDSNANSYEAVLCHKSNITADKGHFETIFRQFHNFTANNKKYTQV